MKKLILLISTLSLLGCTTPNPSKDVCFAIVTPFGLVPVCIEAGEFNDEDRGYPIFESLEEMEEFYIHKRFEGPSL